MIGNTKYKQWSIERGVVNIIEWQTWLTGYTGLPEPPTEARLVIHSEDGATQYATLTESDGFDSANKRWVMNSAASSALPDPDVTTDAAESWFTLYVGDSGTPEWYAILRGEVTLRNDPLFFP